MSYCSGLRLTFLFPSLLPWLLVLRLEFVRQDDYSVKPTHNPGLSSLSWTDLSAACSQACLGWPLLMAATHCFRRSISSLFSAAPAFSPKAPCSAAMQRCQTGILHIGSSRYPMSAAGQ